MTHVSQANSVSTRIVLDDRTFGGFFRQSRVVWLNIALHKRPVLSFFHKRFNPLEDAESQGTVCLL